VSYSPQVGLGQAGRLGAIWGIWLLLSHPPAHPPTHSSTHPTNQTRYDSSADIWSFGITLLELASGRPPSSRMHPMRVIMQTLSGPAPTLADAAGEAAAAKFSKPMHDLVALCLAKDPTARPAAGELLHHKFFKVGFRWCCDLVKTLGLCPACQLTCDPATHL
jgi:serine/threonine protein kinase